MEERISAQKMYYSVMITLQNLLRYIDKSKGELCNIHNSIVGFIVLASGEIYPLGKLYNTGKYLFYSTLAIRFDKDNKPYTINRKGLNCHLDLDTDNIKKSILKYNEVRLNPGDKINIIKMVDGKCYYSSQISSTEGIFYFPLEDVLPSMSYTFNNGNTIVNCTTHDINFKNGDKVITLYTSVVNHDKYGSGVINESETSFTHGDVIAKKVIKNSYCEQIISDILNSDIMKDKDPSKIYIITNPKAAEIYDNVYIAVEEPGYESLPMDRKIFRNNLFYRVGDKPIL